MGSYCNTTLQVVAFTEIWKLIPFFRVDISPLRFTKFSFYGNLGVVIFVTIEEYSDGSH